MIHTVYFTDAEIRHLLDLLKPCDFDGVLSAKVEKRARRISFKLNLMLTVSAAKNHKKFVPGGYSEATK